MSEETAENKYFDRELSWLDFNARVLAEAMDESNPLMDRLMFCGIVGSNMDEFFMVRVASLSEADENYTEIYKKAFALMTRQNTFFSKVLVPRLEENGIVRIKLENLNDAQLQHLERLYKEEILPLLTPIAVQPDEPLTVLANLGLYHVVQLRGRRDPEEIRYAVTQLPKPFPRRVFLPSDSGAPYILMEDLLSLHAQILFAGYDIEAQGLLRLTRGAEMSLNEEKDEDFAKVMTEALRLRRNSSLVRMEISAPDNIIEYFKAQLKISDDKIFRAGDWMDYQSLARLAFQPRFSHLKRPSWQPQPVRELEEEEEIWTVIKSRDVLVHHPYQSFDSFLQFLSLAVDDPDVLAIKQTLYRAAEPSAVIKLLERAAEHGKQVTVLVELKARFDEKRNIEWAQRLIQAGATVLYGVTGLKTHAKACMVVRREAEGIRRYVHLSTGNYNEKTAKLYTDLSLFTANDDIAGDITAFFNLITGYSQPIGFQKISIAPYGLKRRLEKMILRESMRATKEHPGLIMAKMNSLVDKDIIEALYRASQAGVRIRLNVRGICCLRPGVKGLSENIEVISIVDMFLEHSRIFYFENGGNEEIYLSSADWMPRNLQRRLELLFPVHDAKVRGRIRKLLESTFADNMKSWSLQPDGAYKKREPGDAKSFRLQEYLCEREKELQSSVPAIAARELKPQKPKSE